MKYFTREITFVSLFTAFAIVAAVVVRFGSGIVPFSLLPFVVMLAGGILGGRLAATSMALYVILGLIGLPVFATPPFGGPAYVLKPSFGFLIGFILAAYVIGCLVQGKPATFGRYLVASLTGLAVIYIVGLPYLWAILNLYLGKTVNLSGVLKIGFLPFIIPDLVKAVLAAFLSRTVSQRLGDLHNW